MSITIRRTSIGYEADVTPSPGLPDSWSTHTPVDRSELIDQLVRLGYYLQDVVDALSFADADWDRRNE